MKRRGHAESAIRKVVYENPLTFFRQCARWVEWPREEPAAVANGVVAGRRQPASV
jgi:hypothetical protein